MARESIPFTSRRRSVVVRSIQTAKIKSILVKEPPRTKVRLRITRCKAESRQLSWRFSECVHLIVVFQKLSEKERLQKYKEINAKCKVGDRFKMILSPSTEDGRFFDSHGNEILNTVVVEQVEQIDEGEGYHYVGEGVTVTMLQTPIMLK